MLHHTAFLKQNKMLLQKSILDDKLADEGIDFTKVNT